MKRALLVLLVVCLGFAGYGQTAASYIFSQTTTTYTPLSGSTVIQTLWDDGSLGAIPIGFTFKYCGVNYTEVGMNCNGWIQFGSASPGSSYTPLSTGTLRVSGMGDDLWYNSPSTPQNISRMTIGTAPNRIFVMEWLNACRFNISATGPINFQIRLHESTNVVEVVYGPTSSSSTNTYNYHVGIVGASGSDFNNRSTTSDWSATTAGTNNTATCSRNNSVNPANGLTFRWTPPPSVTPSPTSLAFGSVTTGTNSAAQVFSIVAENLNPAAGNITVTAPANFEVSNNGTTWSTSYTIAYTGGAFASTNVFVRFNPTASISYTGNVAITGGGLVSTVNVPVSGSGASACSGTPTAGTATTSLTAAGSATPVTLNLTGTTASGGLAFQWQSSIDGSTGWTNITGATTMMYTLPGVTATRYYRCIVTCVSSTFSSTSSNVLITYFAPSSCTPTFLYPCSAYPMNTSIASLIGAAGAITDPSTTCTSDYTDLTASSSVSLVIGNTYNVTVNTSPVYATSFKVQMWIDFSGDGIFTTDESVGGTNTVTGPSMVIPITVPSTAVPGTFRMRIVGVFSTPAFPSIPPCPTTAVNYGNVRDYSVTLLPPPPAITNSPASIDFGYVPVSGISAVRVFTVNATYMTSTPLTVSTGSSNFQFSFNGTTWFTTPQTYPFTLPGFTAVPLYVRFLPTVVGSATSQITITGGGLATARILPMVGEGVNPCTGTPAPGTASIIPMAGGASTLFTLTAVDYSAASGLAFQWQSSSTGTGGWTNISGATNVTFSFTGITATTFYRCNVTCTPSGITAATNVVSASLFTASSCTPTFTFDCPIYPMNTSIASLVGISSAITDPSSTCTANYNDLTASQSVTLYNGTTYNVTVNTSPPYFSLFRVQMWIDFDGNGTFSAGESVGGTNTITSPTQVIPITIPAGVTPGTFRLRIVGVYNTPSFPSIPPCPTTAVNYGNVRDYTVTVLNQPVCATPPGQPFALSLSSTLFTISGSFIAAASPLADRYLVVRTTTSTPPSAPIDGIEYAEGASALGGVVVSYGSSTSFTVTGLPDNTPFWFWVYSVNSMCTGGPKYRTISPLTSNISTQTCAISGTRTVGPTGDYATIAGAVSAINALGMAGNVILEIQPTYTGETYPINIGSIQCAGPGRRLTIRPQAAMTITANVASPIISMNGARFVTIDGRVGSTGTTRALTIINNSASATANTSAIQFVNDASDNILKFVNLQGANTSTIGGVLYFGTTTGATGSDNNLIDSCDIRDAAGGFPYNCVYATGTTGKENSGNTISNCNIANFYATFTQNCGIFINLGNTAWNITGNRIFQTATRAYSSTQIIRGIWVNNTTSGVGFNINNNIIGHSSEAGTGIMNLTTTSGTSFRGISYAGAAADPASSIQGNIIRSISLDGTNGIMYGIEATSGRVNIGTVTGNTIGAATGNGSITRTMSTDGSIAFRGISTIAALPGVVNIANNTIGSVTLLGLTTTVGVGFYGIEATGTASTTITNNVIGSLTTANSIQSSTVASGTQTMWGIFSSIANTTYTDPIIADNTIANITQAGTGAFSFNVGIVYQGSANAIIRNNIIRNLSANNTNTTFGGIVSTAGICYYGNTLPYATITGNRIFNLENINTTTNPTIVAGISTTNARDPFIARNTIYDLRCASTGTSTTLPQDVIGIHIQSPTTTGGTGTNVVNNMITLGMGQTTNTSFTGIMNSGSYALPLRIYNNSVHIGGTAGSGGLHSACFLRGNYLSSFTTTVDIDNNIFNNTRTGGTGKHYAIADAIGTFGSSAGWPAGASNFNILNSANASTVGFWANTDRTLATWRSATLCDINSYSGTAVTFANLTNGDLHINMGTTPNDIESHGMTIAAFDRDFDNDVRPGPVGSTNGGGFGYDIGADEFDGNPNNNTPPVITYTNNGCGTNTNRTFTVNIADPGGVPTTGSLVPRVYFRKGAGTWFSAPGSLSSGSATNGVWSFTINAATMGGLATADVVSYYVLAQDNGANVGSNTNTSLVATDVNTVFTHPTNPSTYQVGLSGTYTVGSGGNFSTITAAAAAYNSQCLNGAVVYELITPTYPSESFPITFNNNAFASATNSLTIRPAASVNATVTGPNTNSAMFKLFNARFINFDGINTGGRSLTLTSTSTTTYANIWLASTSGTGPGCRNIGLRNMNIVGGSNAITNYGILAGMDNGTFPTTASGQDNDSVTIEGNIFTRNFHCIFASGTASGASVGGLDNWVINNNTFGPATYNASTVNGYRDIMLTNMVNPVISNNTFRNLGITTSANSVAGVYMSSGVRGGVVNNNLFENITSNSASTGTLANTAIYFGTTCLDGVITRNTIRNVSNSFPSSGGGARGIILTISNTFSNTLIANNLISDIKCFSQTAVAFYPIGIAIESGTGLVRVYHNTVHLSGNFNGWNAATGSACFYTNSASGNLDVRNNIFVNQYDNTASGTDKGWAFYTTATFTGFNNLDYNNYFVSGPNVLAFTSADRLSLSELQTLYGGNINSRNRMPAFVSATNLRLQNTSANVPMASGINVGITNDIDGTTRATVNPVLGGHELQLCTSITAGTVTPTVASFCGSGSTTITAAGATSGQTMQWRSSTDSVTWTNIAGATTATYVIPTALTTTTFYRFVNSCTFTAFADSATTKVTINVIPTAVTVAGGGGFCGSTTLTASGGVGGSIYYQGTTSNGTSTATLSSSEVVSATGTYYFRARSSGGCWGTQGSANVTIDALPGTVTIAGAGTFCGSATLTGTGGAGGTIYFQGTTSGGTSTAVGAVGTATATGTYYFRSRSSVGCWGPETSVAVTINPLPAAVTVTGGGTYCGSRLLIAAGGAGGAFYYQGATSGGTSTASPFGTALITTSGTYYFRSRTTLGCWGPEGSANVTINPIPSAAPTNNSPICLGGTVTLSANPGANTSVYTWSGPSLTATTGVTTTANPTTTSVYSLTVSDGSGNAGCSPTTVYTTSVSVISAPVVASISASTSFLCVGSPITFTAGSVAGSGALSSYNWTGPNGYSATTATNSVVFTPTTSASTGAYSVTVTYPGNGCTSSPVATAPSVTVNSRPTIAGVTASSSLLCIGTDLTLTAGAVTGSGSLLSYNWAGPNGFTDVTATNTSTLVTTTAAQSGVYSVTVTYPGAGCNSTVSVTSPSVTVNPLPTVASITPSTTNICAGSNLILTAGAVTGTGALTSYNWSGPNSYSATTTANNVTYTVPNTSASGVYSLSVTYAGTGCNSTVRTTSPAVTVNAVPTVASITPSSNNLCVGTPLTLTAGAVTGSGTITSYNWSGPNGYSATTVASSAVFTPTTTAASGNYSLTVTYAGTGCNSTMRVTSPAVTVNAVPTVASISTSTNNMCVGSPLVLTAGAISGTGTLVSYNWSGPNGYSATTAVNTATLTPTSTAASGNYSVSVTYAGTGCNSTTVATSSAVTVNALPSIASITSSSNNLCVGTPVTFTGGSVTGTGSLVSYNWSGPNSFSTTTSANTTSFTTTTSAQSGVYSLTVTYPGTGCTSNAVTTSPAITVNNLPNVASITASTTQICTGSTITLTAGTASGTGVLGSYNWTGPNGFSTTTSGNSTAVTTTTTAQSGIYSLTVTYPGTGCISNKVTTPTITVNNIPSVTGINLSASTLCAGSVLTLNSVGATGTGTVVSYNWSGPNSYSSTSSTSSQTYTVPGVLASGVYSLNITYPGTGCTSNTVASSTLTVNATPIVYNVTGGGAYCSGGSGVPVGVSNSQHTATYQLYRDGAAIGSPLTGINGPLSFGLQTVAGTYSVQATNIANACNSNMSGTTSVSTSSSPNVYTITGGGTYCEGGTGFAIGLSGSDVGVTYQLYRDGILVGSFVTGTGSAISFGLQTADGNYTVVANPGATCSLTMTGTSVVNMLPAPNVYDMTGGGTICAGDAGVNVGLEWSVIGINYQLYRGSTMVGSAAAGVTGPINFGLINTAGTYTILATNAITGCTSNMDSSAVIIVNPAPATFNVTGGGTTCFGTGSVTVGLDGSLSGHTYQLYNGSAAVGTPVAGTGGAITFGAQNVTGIYSVAATNTATSCTGGMNGSATVIITPAPTAYLVAGGGTYCNGGTGFVISLSNTNTGVNYQLYNGSSPVGSPVAGTGAAINFGMQTAAGTYSVFATNTSTTCTGGMTGTATIVANPLPTAYAVTGGGQYCASSTGLNVGLSFSNTGINYQLYNGSTALGTPVAGTGAAISFGEQTLAGVYTVMATNATTSCTNGMTGSATVVVNPLPIAANITGGGNFCAGAAGVLVGLDASQVDVSYQLYNGVSTVGTPIAGTGSSISFGMQATAGSYSVIATNNTTTCVNNMSGVATVVVNPLPTTYVVTGGGNYCSGGTGVAVGLNGSDAGITYQLYVGSTATGAPVSGTGGVITFGSHTAAGVYSVAAINTATTCTSGMFGTTAVVISPLPAAHTVTGGGSYCFGGTGVVIGLSSSNPGINYQLYNGIAPVSGIVPGTGVSLTFGLQTGAGTYTVLATNTVTTCTRAMTGSANVVVNTLPTQYNVTGGGIYCENGVGVPVGLANSQVGVTYTLYKGIDAIGSPVAGTGAPISFGNQTLAGTYTAVATNNTTGCNNNMTSNALVTINPAPTAYTVTGGGSYCSGGSGVAVGLSGSNVGITYRLYNGASLIGSPVSGTGAALDFGSQLTAGTYTVLATNNVTLCNNPMSSSVAVVINALPIVYNMTGGGGYCVGGNGVSVGLANSQSGVNYQLYRGPSLVGTPVAGTGAAITFGLQTVAGTYSVLATNASTGCTRVMGTTAAVVVNTLPAVSTVYGGGGYCAGGPGVHIGVEATEAGVNYQLYQGISAIGTPLIGTGGGIDFGEVFVSGTYSVQATNALTGCVANMSGTATVVINTPPAAFAVTGGGTYCAGGAGVPIGLSGSAVGTEYRLYNGSTALGSPVSGTGVAISFGNQVAVGTYTVRATGTTTSCTTNMTGSATVSINSNPIAYDVVGGGTLCPGGSGANITLAGSQIGITYQLYMGATTMGTPVTGSGGVLNMGTFTTAGSYSAVATNTLTGCTTNMNGSTTISYLTLPAVYAVTGGGNYCSGGSGSAVGLAGSEVGITYQLYNGATVMGTVVGSGSSIDFGLQTIAGTYTVVATNTASTCTSNMSGSATVGINDLPVIYLVTGGGNYCAGGSGYAVILNGSQSGVNYQLFNGTSPVGSAISGTGLSIDFGLQAAAGFYSVRATNATTGCSRVMAGTPEIIVHSLPVVHTVTGGGNFCSGASGVEVGLTSSATGVDYRLYNSGVLVGAAIAGNGSALSFGNQTAPGIYTVQAINTGTGCTSNMSGSATVVVNPLPAAYAVTGGGSYCNGGAGVSVGLTLSSIGVSYQLYLDGVASGSPVAGDGTSLDFGMKTASGNYTVGAVTAATGCARTMTGSVAVSINPLPSVYTVEGSGSYCTGTEGVNVTLSNSNTGITYTLYNGLVTSGAPLAGTGGALDFGPRTAGNYSIIAINDITSCQSTMNGSATITASPAPVAYSVTGGGAHCAGSTGVAVGLAGSQPNVNYTLYNGVTSTGVVVAGTGSAISFGLQPIAGMYTVRAQNTLTTCTNNMTGSATVSVNVLPVAYNITGGGNYCAGGAGVTVGLSGSQSGNIYQLYKNGTALGAPISGTGTALNFGTMFDNGSYTAVAINASTSCSRAMTGSATVNVNSLPTVYTVSGGGSYCAGGTGVNVLLSGSTTGVNYRLYNGTTASSPWINGNGSALSFGAQTAAGVYTVVATAVGSGCSNVMSSSATVSVNALPSLQIVSGGGAYCAGGAGVNVGLTATESGINYTLYNGSTATGAAISGAGGAISFGNMTNAGTYTVAAVNNTTGCTNNMSGSATVVVNPLPIVHSVIGGGAYCNGGTGVEVALSGSQTGVTYQLYNGSTPVGGVLNGTGDILSYGLQTAVGAYSIIATNTTTACVRSMSGTATVSLNSLPAVYSVIGGGNYCNGGTGVNVGLSNSQLGVNYMLYRGSVATGTTVAGTGAAISFGMQTAAGDYTVMAVNATTACTATMSGSKTVIVNALPTQYSVSAGGNYCPGGSGLGVTLSGSDAGVTYRLYSGATMIGAAVEGTGGAIDFGMQLAGNYTIEATNNVTSCVTTMTGTSAISTHNLPLAYTVTGGGSYCADGTGVEVGLSNSQIGVSYMLYNGAETVGSAVLGTGNAITFGNRTAGNYNVKATNTTTGCENNMTGSVTVNTNSLPNQYDVTGGGNYCAGGTGVMVSISGSQTGVNYRLYNGPTAVGSIVSGNGLGLNFGMQTAAGSYTVRAINATTGCQQVMNGSASVIVNTLPATYTVTGGGNYCAGGTGVNVGIAGSETGISYQLYSGSSMIGSAIDGTGAALDFGAQTGAGNYMVVATNAATSCTANMSGVASVAVNALPELYTLSSSASGYCAGGNGVTFNLSGSQNGVSYTLYNGTTPSGAAVVGTGSGVSFGLRTPAGAYKVVATSMSNGCTIDMNGTPSVTINPLPTVFTVTGGGSYCAGGTGVAVGMIGTQTGVNYNLYRGATLMSTVAGTGDAISFGNMLSGTYTVVAMNTATNCRNNMASGAAVVANPLPSQFAITGGGQYCEGGTGVAIGLAGSSATASYTLYNGATAVGTPVTGTGGVINFGVFTTAGDYTVMATNNTTLCGVTMTGTASVVVNATPTSYNVTGGGSYCAGGTGVTVGLEGSAIGINYRLYNGSTAVGAAVAGTGAAINFGTFTNAGTYTVVASNPATACSKTMTGSATISINALPTVYTVTGGGNYCPGGSGVVVGLSGSVSGVTYSLNRGGSVVATATGTGSAINFGMQSVEGSYSASAVSVSGCSRNMTGAVSVGITTPVTPSVTLASSTGDTVCAGTPVVFNTTQVNGGSTPSYEWKVNGAVVSTISSTYTYVPANGDVVSVTLNSSAACATPATATAAKTITVNANQTPAVATMLSIGDTVCTGTVVTFTASSIYGGTAPSYTWVKNGMPVGTGAVYAYAPVNGDVVYCRMTSNYACRTATLVTGEADTMKVVAPVAPEVTIVANPGTVVANGQEVVLTATVANSFNPAYQWYINGATVMGATSSVFTFNQFQNNDTVSCTVVNRTPCGDLSSFNKVVMSVSSVSVVNVGTTFDVIAIPNPTRGNLQIKGSVNGVQDEEVSIEVTDMLGKSVHRSKAEVRNGAIDTRIQLDNTLANGMYLLTVRSTTASKVFHIVMQQ